MDTPVTYEPTDEAARIVMDDGKANALSITMLDELRRAFDRAEEDGLAVVLAGRPGRFSAGFDLTVLTELSERSAALSRAGFELAHRILSFPRPVVVAVTGHAYAMGGFLVLSCDYRLGVEGGDHRITANEVAIGITLPRAALELCRRRLSPSHFERATMLAEVFDPAGAVEAGWLDELVPERELLPAAQAKAVELSALDARAHEATKRRARRDMLAAMQVAIEEDHEEFLDVVRSLAAAPTSSE